MSVRTSGGTGGRPPRRQLFHVQNRRKPLRCQAMTVSGFTITSLSANRSMKVPATPRATGPSSRGEAGAVATVATPAADGVARGPRDAALRVTAPLHGASKGKKSARMSSRTDLPGTGDKFNNLNTFD